ncbi:MAG TPA: hypothetical protein PLK12_00360, partial [Prolixibacteraceae bacterium]|nr:hypothetical protein [Prolixibacteraceae bacterium]
LEIKLPQPPMLKNYYRDIALYAYPAPADASFSTDRIIPKITTSTGADASFLIDPGNTQRFRSDEPCWIEY